MLMMETLFTIHGNVSHLFLTHHQPVRHLLNRLSATGVSSLRHVSFCPSSPSAQKDTSIQDANHLNELCNEIMKNQCCLSNQIKELCNRYLKCESGVKSDFLLNLARNHATNHQESLTAAQTFFKSINDDASPGKLVNSLDALRSKLTPSYVTLFQSIFKTPDGIRFLVNLRADLLETLARKRKEEKERSLAQDKDVKKEGDKIADLKLIQSLEQQLRAFLSIAFSVGFLHVHQVTWDSPAALIEKIAAHEAVHPVLNWIDIKKRLGPGRRCYVFTHPSLPGEPLVILHVALTTDIHPALTDIISAITSAGCTSSESDIIGHSNYPLSLTSPTSPMKGQQQEEEEEDLSDANTALFYSISSPQKGLNGIELGMQMIREVTRRINEEFPGITQFSTLSPIPGFRHYLVTQVDQVVSGSRSLVDNFFREEELMSLEEWLLNHKDTKTMNVWEFLAEVLKCNSWIHDQELSRRLRGPMMRKCAHYLFHEKEEKGYAVNPVANFHMKNGAQMYRLNWRADLSPRGLANSCGLMINYRYFLEDYEVNGHRYQSERVIPVSDTFKQTLQS